MVRRVTVVAHFDAAGEVKPYVVHYVRALAELSERVIFMSTAPGLDPASRARLEGVCEPPVLLDNHGYDFRMWRQALAGLDLSAYDEVVLTNSSVFGPVGSLAAVFDRMADAPVDFWGMTDNHELHWHVQSYFVVLRRAALDSPALTQFFGSILPYTSKWQVIHSYELGLTTFLEEAGLRSGVVCRSEAVWPQWRRALGRRFKKTSLERSPNLTIFCPRPLLEWGVPLVKVEVFRDNPGDVDLDALRADMRARGYPDGLVHVG